jgi:hypothetical protein
MPNGKGVFVGLSDLSFRDLITPRIIRWLYLIALLAGGVSLVVAVFWGLQQSAGQGMAILVFGLAALFVWVLYVRVVLEVVIVLFQIAENTRRMAGGA